MPTSSSAPELLSDPLLRDVPTIEGYKVLAGVALYAKVGQGGMGVVYRGRHCLLDIDMAVKVLKPSLVAEDERFALRFRREAQVAAHITHQNVVRLYEANQQSGLHYLLMEFVDGESVRDRVPRKGPLPLPEALGILLGAASGVAEAHRIGVVHRDIKPDNVLVARDGRVKVADLGLVKRDGGGDSVTLGSAIMGTPQYMAPEQWESPDVTPAADVWALGGTLWFLLVGEHAIAGSTLAAMARRVLEQDYPSLRQARPDLPVAVYELFERCVQRRPADRFVDARALVEALLPLVRGGEEKLADPEAGLGGSRPALPTPPPRATIARIRDVLGTDTALASTGVQRSEARTVVGKGATAGNAPAAAPSGPRATSAPWRRRGLVAGMVLLVGAVGTLLAIDDARDWCASWVGLSRQQRAEAVVQRGRELQDRGALDAAITEFEAAYALHHATRDALMQGLRQRIEATLADARADRAAVEQACIDVRRVTLGLWYFDKEWSARARRAEAALAPLVAKAFHFAERRDTVVEGPRLRFAGTVDWPDVTDVRVRLFAPGPPTADTTLRGQTANGRFEVAGTVAPPGQYSLLLSYDCPRGNVQLPLGEHVVVAGLQCANGWLQDARTAPESVRLCNAAGITMRYVPVRTFTMGSLRFGMDRKDDEFQHAVTLTQPFWLGRSEVTREQWVRVMKTTPWSEGPDGESGEVPATRITHTMADEFCAALTRLETVAKRLPAGYRYCLPTEAQWELAAHGGGYQRHVHGDKPAGLELHAVFVGKSRSAAPVATKQANPFGLHDLAGNVDEWCEDLALAKDGLVTTLTYQDGVTDPLGNVGPLRVYRGGNFRSPAADCRVSARFAAPPDTARDTLGFRVALAKR